MNNLNSTVRSEILRRFQTLSTDEWLHIFTEFFLYVKGVERPFDIQVRMLKSIVWLLNGKQKCQHTGFQKSAKICSLNEHTYWPPKSVHLKNYNNYDNFYPN